MLRCLFLVIIFTISNAAFAQSSVYTKLNLEKSCVFHTRYEQGGSAYCSGYKGYPVHFSEGDLRQMMRFGHVASLLGQWESFSQFNRINNTIEWRLKGGKPYATILRWFIENVDGNGEYKKKHEGQVLVITKVADVYNEQPVSCVVGYVDARANKDANKIAHMVADTISSKFKCIAQEPVFHGNRGKYSGTPVSSYE